MTKRMLTAVLTVALTLSLTACGKEPAKNDRNDAGSGQNSAYDAVSDSNRDNVPNNDAIIGRDDHTVTAPDTNPAPNPTNEPAGDLPGVCPLSGPVPVRGVQPCEGKGLRRAAGGEGR